MNSVLSDWAVPLVLTVLRKQGRMEDVIVFKGVLSKKKMDHGMSSRGGYMNKGVNKCFLNCRSIRRSLQK
jgi:hypothetical protein